MAGLSYIGGAFLRSTTLGRDCASGGAMGRKGTLQLLIWVATLLFVVMMFVPLILELGRRLGQGIEGVP